METSVFAMLFCGVIVVLFFWVLLTGQSGSSTGELIDPDDAGQIGRLVGLAGGDIPSAAVLRFALQRFEQIHGRKATTRDIGIVLGITRSSDLT